MVVSTLSNRKDEERSICPLPIVNIPYPSKRLNKLENMIGNVLLLIWVFFPLMFLICTSILIIPVLVALFG